MEKQPSSSSLPRQFGDYQVLEKLGRGGMATVYKARHVQTGELAALKIASRFLTLEPAIVARFEREFAVAHRLDHPNIVRALGNGQVGGTFYLVLEYVPGLSLELRLKNQGPMPLHEAIPIFIDIAAALSYLHANHLLHRDIKPGNILLHEQGPAKLGDFGLLKSLATDTNLTQSNEGLGTMEYASPEQFENAKHVDVRSDLYSLAATFYTSVTGIFPFGTGGQIKILSRKLNHQLVPLLQLLPGLSPVLDQFITRCLHPDPQQRPDCSAEFRAALKTQDLTPRPALSPPPAPAPLTPSEEEDRRARVRYAIKLAVTCEPLFQKTKQAAEATILDVSANGLCLQTANAFEVNSVIQVTWQNQVDELDTSHLVRVRWVKNLEPGAWILGCAFVQPLAEGAFEEIFHSGSPPTKVDRPAKK